MSRTVAYYRVSTKNQTGDKAFGLAAQAETVAVYARREGITIDEVFTDGGASGSTLDRPALQALLHACRGGGVARVIVPRLDRLNRDLLGQLIIERELKETGVTLSSATEAIEGDDPSSVMIRQIFGAISQMERAMIAARLRGGRRAKAAQGGFAGSGCPYGYTPAGGRLEVDPKAAEVVRRVFKARRRGLSLREIAAQFNGEGIPTRRGAKWTAVQVKNILGHKAFYRGRYIGHGADCAGQHPAIL
jgi:DNA invertase Pin-like site-specific DNA recombinase